MRLPAPGVVIGESDSDHLCRDEAGMTSLFRWRGAARGRTDHNPPSGARARHLSAPRVTPHLPFDTPDCRYAQYATAQYGVAHPRKVRRYECRSVTVP